MADWHGMMSKSSKDEDFEEKDVWSFASDHQQSCEDSSPQMRKPFKGHSAWRFSTAPRMITRANNNIPTTTTHEANKGVQQSSAPVKIPDWSKIYGKNANFLGLSSSSSSSSRNGSWVDNDGHDGNGISNDHVVYNGTSRDYYHHSHGHHGDGDDDDNEDGNDGTVPPHEWLAKKLARSQISSFSVCEGIGRTLKGRDLSKVRNAILTKTGFLE
ncbi:hypothetical protein ACOSP7_012901 [Xanthoceras sorbifolium]|uniref:Senescence regulator S40 n=1 Tax=Xanthoceras sorbifolium TaxID=99658 RepID=A0ABQ8HYT1_9ROSI|nr:hypothetical protein JRO89_XS06G0170100 [Xanthoceras sorbifolium]